MHFFACLQRWFRRFRRLRVKCTLCLIVSRQSHYLCVTCQACCCRSCSVEDIGTNQFYCRWCTKHSSHIMSESSVDHRSSAGIRRGSRRKPRELEPVLDYSDVPVLEVKTAKMFLTTRQVLAIRNMASSASTQRLTKSA
ncbi:hypothetical protein H257_14858 [Aphanomyces astaci]|uniref:Uncharacterized protein n=1 Tax=Aphanomyces astaci TaxID=112090 RepID=W4FPV1_APHAT|nr:hypothetical protein H257_14858 [Aphanomyces astaci]ETV69490.1 hypothetical protein H257_14858 [Aphanomyces astaci]|eukprot:XP_009841063.1 hypothetical protein H257_14858 [Aphanomyces astaci]